jgi:CspA family cold shock protein
MRAKTAEGTVKTWHPELGWGVITSPDVGEVIWAHFSAIEATGYRELHPGDAVAFSYHRGDQDGYGYVANAIRRK